MRIDNNAISDNVTTDRGDWHLYQPDNSASTYLTQGQHVIHLEGTLSDVPNAERVMTPESATLMDANTRYAKMKNHENYANYSTVNADTLETNYRVINYNSSENDTTRTPFLFNAELNKEVYYTFLRVEYYTQGQTVSITTDEVNGVGHDLNVFSKSASYNTTWADSTYNGHANLTITIPRTDFYYIMVRTQSPTDYGTCNLTINNDKKFEGVPISNSHTSLQHIHFGPIYSCFAKSSVGDPMIFLVGNNGKVIYFNDDYPYSSQNFNWGTNARIDGLLFTNLWLQTIAKSYPPEVVQRIDIYVGCESEYEKDAIYSSKSDTAQIHYNCIAWSVGEWKEWINPKPTLEMFDDFYSGYGYERTENADSAVIDLWMKGNKFTHASIKSKANPYATGFDWESKNGMAERMFHPRDTIYENYYGHIAYHYKKSTQNRVLCTIQRFSFTQQETMQIENGLKKVPENIKKQFDKLLLECYHDRALMLCNNTCVFPKFATYNKLLDFCRQAYGIDFLLYKEIGNRKVISVKILQDITEERNPLILKEVEEQCERLCLSSCIKMIRNVQADGMLLVKLLLSGTSESEDLNYFAERSFNYNIE